MMYYDKTAQVLVGAARRHRRRRRSTGPIVSTDGAGRAGTHTRTTSSTPSQTWPRRDLSWFWTTWFYQPGRSTRQIASVESQGDSTAITIEDRGLAPMPVVLAITREGGSVLRLTLPADIWLSGTRRHVVRVPASPAIVKVEIDPDALFPDMGRANQLWPMRR